MNTIKLYQPGQSAINYQVESGTTLSQFFANNNIEFGGGFKVTVNAKAVDVNEYEMSDGDKVLITKSEVKGG